jgi:hypothetical protein
MRNWHDIVHDDEETLLNGNVVKITGEQIQFDDDNEDAKRLN